MFTLKSLPEFDAWLAGLRDPLVRSAVMKRLTQVELGLLGDTRSLADGVSEEQAGASITPNAVARSSFCSPAVQNGSNHAILHGQKPL